MYALFVRPKTDLCLPSIYVPCGVKLLQGTLDSGDAKAIHEEHPAWRRARGVFF